MALAENINDREKDKFGFESGETYVRVKDIAGSSGSAAVYDTNNIDAAGSGITYIGKESSGGVYLILKIDESANPTVFRYATLNNNASVLSYADAWTNRATLSYSTRGA
jgi:hypothetical protein